MFAVATAIVALLIFATALLAVPLVLVIEAKRADTLTATWRVRWLFGLVDVRSSGSNGGQTGVRPGSDAATSPPRPARRRRRAVRIGMAVLRTRGLPRRVGRLALSLRRQVRLDEFHVRTAFGCDDPADTGVVYGVLSPLLVMARLRGMNVDCRPMFLESGLQGTLSGTIHVRPLLVVGALVMFLVSPPVIKAARSAWRVRK